MLEGTGQSAWTTGVFKLSSPSVSNAKITWKQLKSRHSQNFKKTDHYLKCARRLQAVRSLRWGGHCVGVVK